ncbi:hypothetical protein [Athalassotoga sp.]|uniref:Uncharacterized protein n=1 Tax=Caldisericum exile TaxID=693075 RepID=A0A2J6X7N6_9BACT|nr:MAG: hypothetical protein C0175_02455 [Caldisericum exile]
MRKIYVLLILISIIATLSFADNWLNAQTEIQKSFNSNSPGQNLQNQLLGSTNTNNSFLNLGSSVNALGASNDPSAVTLNECVSSVGANTFNIPLSALNGIPADPNWTYSITNFNGNGITLNSTSVSYSKSKPSTLNLNVTVPSNYSLPNCVTMTLLATQKNGQTKQWNITLNISNCDEQSYIATATSYDASFCGVTGNVLTNSYTPFDGGVLLAKLAVQSNMSMITVEVSTGVNGGSLTSGISPSGLPNGMTLHYSNNYTENGNVLTLPIGSNPYSGELDIFASNGIASWATPGQTILQFQFTIIPNGSY